MTSAEKAGLYRELAKMIEADFHLDRSLALLLKQRRGGPRRLFLEGVQRGLEQGRSVAEAVASTESGQISSLETSIIEAGEQSGRLGAAFTHLAHYFGAVEKARRAAWQGMVYPLVLLHLAILLPEIPTAILAPERGFPVPKMVVAVVVLWAVIAGSFGFWRVLAARAETSVTMDSALNRLPFVGSVRRHWALARFSQVFHAGLLAGMRMSKIVTMAGEASQSGRLRQAGEQTAACIEAGEPVAESLRGTGAFPRDFVNALTTAEEVGVLDEELARWAVAETDLATEAIGRASLWLPKIGYAVIALFVVYRIFGMLSAYYGSFQQFDL